MIDLARRFPLITALAIVAVLLAGVLALEFASGAALRERIAAGAAPRAVAVQTKLLPSIAAVNPDQEYAETGTRPLFTPTRRPAPPQAAPTTAPTMVKGQFSLTGVTIVGPTRIALLREKSSGRVVRVEQGKEVNGLTVAQIDPDKVTLTQGGDREEVGMLVAKAGGQPAPPAPAPSAAGPFAPPQTAAAPAPPQLGLNPAARASPPAGQPGAPAAPPAVPPAVNPNTLFGPRPSGLTPAPGTDPTTATPLTSAAPMTPEELLARRRARRNQQ